MQRRWVGRRSSISVEAALSSSVKLAFIGSLAVVAASCGGSEDSATLTPDFSVTSMSSSPDTVMSAPASTSSSDTSSSVSADASIVNTWVGPPADTSKLPIGTSRVSLTTASIGGLYACDAGNPAGGGVQVAGPWLDEATGTWDLSKKVSVQGEVTWPMASYSEEVVDGTRRITSNGLPVGAVTGTFPVAADDPAYAFDRNPNRIAASDVTISLPLDPVKAATPTCLGKGRVGILKNGVSLFASLDELNRDAVAYETQDKCDGHPQQTSVYHYHDVPSCIRDAAQGASTVVGFAYDGFPIVVERDANGDLPTNSDLDECHGRTSTIELDGELIEMYHYSATHEFPYFIGCFAGTPIQ